jgi:hypothetical protein
MTGFAPVYRTRIYEPRSASVAAGRDPAVNPALLQPAANAPHQNDFQIATAMGIPGFQPIMGIPKGRRSAFDAATKVTDVPELVVDILDINAVAGAVGNAALWVTAFVGTAKGNLQMSGCLAMVEESLDGGATWNASGRPYFVGRVESLTLTRPRVYTLKIRDTSDTLQGQLFAAPLRADVNRSVAMLSPYGISKSWNGIKGIDPYFVTETGLGKNPDGTNQPWVEIRVSLNFGSPPVCNSTTWVHDGISQAYGNDWTPKEGIRAVFILPDGSEKHMWVNIGRSAAMQYTWSGSWSGMWTMPVVSGFGCTPVDAGDPYYIAADSLNGAVMGGTTRCYLIHYTLPGGVDEDNPLLIERHPVDMLKDVLDGKYSRRKADGTPLFTIDYNLDDFDLTKWSHVPTGSWKITKAEKMIDFITKSICLPHGMAFVMEPSWNGVNAPRGRFRLINTSTDSVLANLATVASLTDADLVSEKPPRWQHNRKDAAGIVEVSYYRDTLGTIAQHASGSLDVGKAPSKMLESTNSLSETVTLDPQGDIGEKKISVDAVSIRYSATLRGRIREGVAQSEAQASGLRFTPFSRGPLYVEFTCLRTTISQCWPGDWRFNETSYLPDASINQRGGKRLLLCVKREEDGLFIKLTFLDCGVEGIAAPPSFGTQSIGAQYGLVRSALTLNAAGDPVVLQYAETPASQTVPPAVGDPIWAPARVALADTFELPYDVLSPYAKPTADATDTYIIVHRPTEGRMWIRGRSTGSKSHTQPSAWVVANPTDTLAPAAPTGLAIANITTKTAVLSWTNATDTDPVEVFLGTGAGGLSGLQSVFQLPAKSTSFTLSGLDNYPVGGMLAGVRHYREASGLFSPIATVAFSTYGAPAPADVDITAIYNGSPYNGLAAQPGDQTGIRVYIVPGAAGHAVEIWECDPIYNFGAPDAPAGPDVSTARLAAVIPGAQVPIEGFYWTKSPMPLDHKTRYYRARHHGDNYAPGGYTAWVANVPVVLQPVPAVRLTGLPTCSITPSASNVQASETLTLNGARSPGSIGGVFLKSRVDGPDVSGVYQTGAWSAYFPAAFPQTVTVNRDPAAVIQYNVQVMDAETGQESAVASHRILPSSQVPGATGLQRSMTLGPAEFIFKAGVASGWYIDHDVIAGRNEFGSGFQTFDAIAPFKLPVGARITAFHADLFQNTSSDAATVSVQIRRNGGPASGPLLASLTTGTDHAPGEAAPGISTVTVPMDFVVQAGDRFGLNLSLSATVDGGRYPCGLVRFVIDYTLYTVV